MDFAYIVHNRVVWDAKFEHKVFLGAQNKFE